MDDARTTAIRERAYQLWLAEGQPEGRPEAHWKHAEQEYDARHATNVQDPSDPATSLAIQPPSGVPEPKF